MTVTCSTSTTSSPRKIFVAARALRRALRDLALANTLGEPLAPERRSAVDRAFERVPARASGRRRRPGRRARGQRRPARARDDRRPRRRGADGRRLGAAEGLPPGDLRLALLRRLAQPLVELVLDADLRRPRESARVPSPARVGRAMNGGRYVVSLALGRLARRRGGALGAALGIAAAAAVLAGVLVGGTVAQDRSVAQDVERLPADARAVRAVVVRRARRAGRGVAAARPCGDRGARAGSRRPAPTRIALVRESTIARPLRRARRGRRPRARTSSSARAACRARAGRSAARCCVSGAVGRLPDVPGLRVVEVGTATLRSRQLFGDFLAPTDNALADAELAPALARRGGLPPPAAGTARRRGGGRGAHLLTGARALVPQLRLGAAARRRHAAPLGDRPARREAPTGLAPRCSRASPHGR